MEVELHALTLLPGGTGALRVGLTLLAVRHEGGHSGLNREISLRMLERRFTSCYTRQAQNSHVALSAWCGRSKLRRI